MPQFVLDGLGVFRLDHYVADDAAALGLDFEDELAAGGEGDGGAANQGEAQR